LKLTVPVTAAPAAPVNWNVEAVIEDDIIASLKVAEMVALSATFVAPVAGVTAVTVGTTGGGGGGVDDEPHPETRSADARRQAIPRRSRRMIWVLLGFSMGGENGRSNSQPRTETLRTSMTLN
jgi:hypothetical protein